MLTEQNTTAKKQAVNLELCYFPILSLFFQGDGKLREILKKVLHTVLQNQQALWDTDIPAREQNLIRKPKGQLVLSKPQETLHTLGWPDIMYILGVLSLSCPQGH